MVYFFVENKQMSAIFTPQIASDAIVLTDKNYSPKKYNHWCNIVVSFIEIESILNVSTFKSIELEGTSFKDHPLWYLYETHVVYDPLCKTLGCCNTEVARVSTPWYKKYYDGTPAPTNIRNAHWIDVLVAMCLLCCGFRTVLPLSFLPCFDSRRKSYFYSKLITFYVQM